MPDDPENNETSGDDETTELVLEDVVKVEADKLDDDQITYLQENEDKLTDEQKETYKEALEKPEEDVDPKKVKIQTRVPKKKVKPKTEPEGDDDDDEDDEEVEPGDKKTIGRVVKEEIKPLQDQLTVQQKRSQKLADEGEVDSFIRDNPEMKKYRAVILKYMKDPSHDNLPAASIAAIVSAGDQQKIGATKEREATEKAKETQGGGSTVRKPTAGEKDWAGAETKDVTAKKQEILDKSRE